MTTTVVKMEGFDLTGVDENDLITRGFTAAPTANLATTGGKFGGGCIECTSVFGLGFAMPTIPLYVCVTVWMKAPATLVKTDMITLSNIENAIYHSENYDHTTLHYSLNGSITLEHPGGNIAGTSAIGVILPDTWHHIELRCYCSGAGTCQVYVDGVLALDIDGDFQAGAGEFMTVLLMGGDGGTVSPGNTFDDLIIREDGVSFPALLGAHRIHTLLPSADTAQADWTGTYADIDDPLGAFADGDTTYISTTTLNGKSEFAVGDLPVSPTTVHAMQTSIVAKKTDANAKGVTAYVKHSTSIGSGTEFSAADSVYGAQIDIHELNPNGSVAWTETTINAMLLGVEITT